MHLLDNLGKCCTIFTDSMSTLSALRNVKLRNEILTKAYDILSKNPQIRLEFVPAHTNIRENDIVDIIAKNARKRIKPDQKIIASREEFKTIAKQKLLKQPEHLLFQLFKNSRTDLKNLVRLESGANGLNSYLKKIQRHNNGRCDSCRLIENRDHYLWHCKDYQHLRYILEDPLYSKSEKNKYLLIAKYIRATNKKI